MARDRSPRRARRQPKIVSSQLVAPRGMLPFEAELLFDHLKALEAEVADDEQASPGDEEE